MRYSVRVTSSFRKSVGSAISYIADVLCMPRSAEKLAMAVADALEALEDNATFLPVDVRASALLGRTVYRLHIRNYRLYYVVDKESAAVTVFSFLHRRQNRGGHLAADFESE